MDFSKSKLSNMLFDKTLVDKMSHYDFNHINDDTSM